MKTRKHVLPKWVLRSIPLGKENENLCSSLVGIVVFYLMGVIAFSVFNPFKIEGFWTMVLIFFLSLIAVICLCFWLTAEMSLIKSMRDEALLRYSYAKTPEEIALCKAKFDKLCIEFKEKQTVGYSQLFA